MALTFFGQKVGGCGYHCPDAQNCLPASALGQQGDNWEAQLVGRTRCQHSSALQPRGSDFVDEL